MTATFTFNGFHFAIAAATFAIGLVAGAVMGWLMRDERG